MRRRSIISCATVVSAVLFFSSSGCLPIDVREVQRNMDSLPPRATSLQAIRKLQYDWFNVPDDSPHPSGDGYEIVADRWWLYWLVMPFGQHVIVTVKLDRELRVTAVWVETHPAPPL